MFLCGYEDPVPQCRHHICLLKCYLVEDDLLQILKALVNIISVYRQGHELPHMIKSYSLFFSVISLNGNAFMIYKLYLKCSDTES